MQCFSQAPLIMPRPQYMLPGVEFSSTAISPFPPRNSRTAPSSWTSSDPALPLILDMQIRVGTDGSHTFEQLDMSRP
ncbi:MAG: hypothetical protein ACLSAH_13060 [Bilophila wadsworthia]